MSLNYQHIFNRVWQDWVIDKCQPGVTTIPDFGNKPKYVCSYGKPGSESRCSIGRFDTHGALVPYDTKGIRYVANDGVQGHDALKVIFPDIDFFGNRGFWEKDDCPDVRFLVMVQNCHDKSFLDASEDPTRTTPLLEDFREKMKRRLEQLARNYRLSIPQ